MSFIKELISTQPAKPPRQAEPVEPLAKDIVLERRNVITADRGVKIGVPNHDPSHPNYPDHKALVDLLKARRPDIHSKLMNWD